MNNEICVSIYAKAALSTNNNKYKWRFSSLQWSRSIFEKKTNQNLCVVHPGRLLKVKYIRKCWQQSVRPLLLSYHLLVD